MSVEDLKVGRMIGNFIEKFGLQGSAQFWWHFFSWTALFILISRVLGNKQLIIQLGGTPKLNKTYSLQTHRVMNAV